MSQLRGSREEHGFLLICDSAFQCVNYPWEISGKHCLLFKFPLCSLLALLGSFSFGGQHTHRMDYLPFITCWLACQTVWQYGTKYSVQVTFTLQ